MQPSIVKKIFSWIFPPQCIICSTEETVGNICVSCCKNLEVSREIGRPWIFSLYHYRHDPVTNCVQHLKNFPDQELVDIIISQRMPIVIGWIKGLLTTNSCDSIILVPVPIHRSRFLDRGYNQTEIIARSLAKIIQQKLSIPVSLKNDWIQKFKKTEKQALITDRAHRFKNITGSFTLLPNDINNQNSLIIIIDDITTTGGTLQTIRELFPDQQKVFGFTLGH